jgi:F0F1-type ATP synthase delta subunit
MKNQLYLVAWYYMKPRKGVNTSQKGWMDNPANIQWDEQFGLVRKLGNKENNAPVVLNLVDQCIERNRFQTERSFDEVFKYFFANYHKDIIQVMMQHAPKQLDEIVARLEKEYKEQEIAEATVLDEKVQA